MQTGICFDVETSSAESPMAVGWMRTAASTIDSTGTWLPRSYTR